MRNIAALVIIQLILLGCRGHMGTEPSDVPVLLTNPFAKSEPSRESEIAVDQLITQSADFLIRKYEGVDVDNSSIEGILQSPHLTIPRDNYFDYTSDRYVYIQEDGSAAVQFDIVTNDVGFFVPTICHYERNVEFKRIVPTFTNVDTNTGNDYRQIYELSCENMTLRFYIVEDEFEWHLRSIIVFKEL